MWFHSLLCQCEWEWLKKTHHFVHKTALGAWCWWVLECDQFHMATTTKRFFHWRNEPISEWNMNSWLSVKNNVEPLCEIRINAFDIARKFTIEMWAKGIMFSKSVHKQMISSQEKNQCVDIVYFFTIPIPQCSSFFYIFQIRSVSGSIIPFKIYIYRR